MDLSFEIIKFIFILNMIFFHRSESTVEEQPPKEHQPSVLSKEHISTNSSPETGFKSQTVINIILTKHRI